MARYIVNVVVGGRTTRLLVVLEPSQLCSALLDKVNARLPGLGISPDSGNVALRLEAVDGPILDTEDLLSEVLPDPSEQVFAVVSEATNVPKIQDETPLAVTNTSHSDVSKPLRLRVITPELARSHPDVNKIPLLPENVITFKSTLRELKSRVKHHLDVVSDETYHELDCNCSFAREIHAHAELNTLGCDDSETSNTVIVVYANNKVANVTVDEPILSRLEEKARKRIRPEVFGKHMTVIGGVEDPSTRNSGTTQYLKLPILSFCAANRHEGSQPTHRSAFPQPNSIVLDLHTEEMPIEMTAHNVDLSLETIGLGDCTINGALNIYAVKRHENIRSRDTSRGKEAIYKKHDSWEHPNGQSERGLANFLSSLRVFASLIRADKMERRDQDALLHLFYLLTSFPPAVRAVHILMHGKTPQNSERAALSQCFYEILKTVVPLQIVNNDSKRLFEGSRLLFGLLLEKSKHLKISMHDPEDTLVYMDSMKVHELRNMITMDPVLAHSIQTYSGLVDRGFFDAFDNGALLRWTNGYDTRSAPTLDRKLHRAAFLSGGTKAQVVSFDVDAINNSRYSERVEQVITVAEYTDLQYLATLCSRNELGVIPPSSLPSADPPVLTLDRNGFLAVYVGRQACGEAGRDINMFRPTSSIIEESVDVSIISQLLVPILEQRNADGTAVFEAFGDQHRRLKEPDEIVMLCVDCSSSMDKRCGFIDVEENEDAVDSDPDGANDICTSDEEEENLAYERPALDELKEFLSSHESFDDFLAIIRTGTDDFHRHRNAEKVLKILRTLDQQNIQLKTEELEDVSHRATNYYFRQRAEAMKRELATLKNRSLRLQQYMNSLCAFLLYRAENAGSLQELLTWQLGDTVPSVRKQNPIVENSPKFEIPAEYLCPISGELMDDPVITIDNFTYERNNIERWFQTHETSPLTNVNLDNLDVRPNVQLKQQIITFINGSDIISRYTDTRSSRLLTFKSPLTSWILRLPLSMSLHDMYEIGFRVTKGRYPNFELRYRNALLPPSQQPANASITGSHEVFITPVDLASTSTTNNEVETLCLVKVYANSYINNVVSYWEPKATTKSLASAIFRYYRHEFTQHAWPWVDTSFTLWTSLTCYGDNTFRGNTQNHWVPISRFFNRDDATGALVDEPVYNNIDEDGGQHIRSQEGSGASPLVFKLYLGSKPRKKNDKYLSRMDVLKQMFDAFINRILAYNFQTHIGLVTCRSTPAVEQGITHAVENFRHQLNNMTASGDTALWDSIALAQDQLQAYAEKFPKAKLRVICLSDGEDNKSKQQVHEVSMQLMQANILLDSFCLGEVDNQDLKTLSYLSGGYKFQPNTLEEAMAICEMEPVLSREERPEVTLPRCASKHIHNPLRRFRRAYPEVNTDAVTRDSYPQRKEHPQLSESFIALGQLGRFNPSNRTDSNLRLNRIHNEIRNSGAKVHPHYDIYICEPNFGLWKIVMQGPPGSSYADGTFLMYLEMGENYPAFPPDGRFVTPIYHPNINRHGRICHSILDRNWTVDTTNKDVIDTIYSLLLVPEFSDPINAVVTLNFHWDEVQFREEAQRHIDKHAKKTREEWSKEILG